MTDVPHEPGKVAYILKMFPRFSETFILSEILELERQGMALRIFSLKLPNDGRFHADVAHVKAPVTYLPPVAVASFRDYLAPHWRVFGWNPRRYLSILWRTIRRRRWGALKRFMQAGYIAPQLRDAGITHVHAHFASSATSVALYLHQLIGLSYSFTAHAKDIYIDGVAQDVLQRKLDSASFIVTVSDYNRAHLASIAPQAKIVRIYNGLDLRRFSPNGTHPETVPFVLAVGRLVEKKGFDVLVRACAILKSQRVPFQCRIIGTGALEHPLRALIAELNLDDLIELPGPMPREALITLYPRASVVVAPCVIGSDGNRDGLPTVLIEAMALGVPVISTDVTGIPELVQHERTGSIVPQNDPVALAAAIRTSLEQRTHAMEMAREGRCLVERRFDLRRNVTELRSLLEKASQST
jgi:glycosyltransferase involved in cell wall biosynthesis